MDTNLLVVDETEATQIDRELMEYARQVDAEIERVL